MTGFIKKNYTIVIMDGSDLNVVRNITGVVEMMTKSLFNRITCENMDENHPTMKVVRTTTNKKTYEQIKNVLTERYPGLCVFNVTV